MALDVLAELGQLSWPKAEEHLGPSWWSELPCNDAVGAGAIVVKPRESDAVTMMEDEETALKAIFPLEAGTNTFRWDDELLDDTCMPYLAHAVDEHVADLEANTLSESLCWDGNAAFLSQTEELVAQYDWQRSSAEWSTAGLNAVGSCSLASNDTALAVPEGVDRRHLSNECGHSTVGMWKGCQKSNWCNREDRHRGLCNNKALSPGAQCLTGDEMIRPAAVADHCPEIRFPGQQLDTQAGSRDDLAGTDSGSTGSVLRLSKGLVYPSAFIGHLSDSGNSDSQEYSNQPSPDDRPVDQPLKSVCRGSASLRATSLPSQPQLHALWPKQGASLKLRGAVPTNARLRVRSSVSVDSSPAPSPGYWRTPLEEHLAAWGNKGDRLHSHGGRSPTGSASTGVSCEDVCTSRGNSLPTFGARPELVSRDVDRGVTAMSEIRVIRNPRAVRALVDAIHSPRTKRRVGTGCHKIAANPHGHACTTCGTQSTPVWRAGPHGPKTLCNACGVRYMKKAKRT